MSITMAGRKRSCLCSKKCFAALESRMICFHRLLVDLSVANHGRARCWILRFGIRAIPARVDLNVIRKWCKFPSHELEGVITTRRAPDAHRSTALPAPRTSRQISSGAPSRRHRWRARCSAASTPRQRTSLWPASNKRGRASAEETLGPAQGVRSRSTVFLPIILLRALSAPSQNSPVMPRFWKDTTVSRPPLYLENES